MSRVKIICFSGFVLGLLGVLAFMQMSTDGASREVSQASQSYRTPKHSVPTASKISAHSCSFSVGEQLSYEVNLEGDFVFNIGPLFAALSDDSKGGTVSYAATPEQKKSYHTRWRLDLEALDVRLDGASVLGARLEFLDDGGISPSGEDTSPTFLMLLSESCAIESFARHKDASAKGAYEQQAMVSVLQFEAPSRPSVDAYHVTQIDMLGHRTTQFLPEEGGLRGEVLSYQEVFAKGEGLFDSAPRIEVKRSQATVNFGEESWFESSSSELSVELYAETVVIGSIKRSHKAWRAPSEGWRAEVDPESPEWVWGLMLGHKKPNRRIEAARDDLDEVTLNSAFNEMISLRKNAGLSVSLFYMRDWIRTHPEELPRLRQLLLKDAFKDTPAARLSLFTAMGLANTPESREFLMEVFTNGEHSRSDMIRAASALVGSDPVPEGYVEALIEHSSMETDQHGRMALMLGSLIDEQRDANPEVAQRARDELRGWLENPQDDAHTKRALTSAGNAGDEALFESIEPYLDHSDPEIREASTHALQNMPPEVAIPRIKAILNYENQRQVRSEGYSVLREQLSRDPLIPIPEINEYLLSQLPAMGENDPEYAITIELLGHASRHHGDEEARDAINREFAAEMAKTPKNAARLKLLGAHHNTHWSAHR